MNHGVDHDKVLAALIVIFCIWCALCLLIGTQLTTR
jgi:hypothetical protein